jgi:hypothetical protein
LGHSVHAAEFSDDRKLCRFCYRTLKRLQQYALTSPVSRSRTDAGISTSLTRH